MNLLSMELAWNKVTLPEIGREDYGVESVRYADRDDLGLKCNRIYLYLSSVK